MANIDVKKEVRVHKQLAEALRTESLNEIELEGLFFLFAKISKSHKDDTVYYLKLDDLERLTGHSYNLSDYVSAFKRLRQITLTIDRGESILVSGVLNDADLVKGKRTVEVTISKKMKPYLLGLTNNYTKNQLFSILRLGSKNSKKLYLYLCQYRPKKGVVRHTIESLPVKELRDALGFIDHKTGKEQYGSFGNFNNRVLKKAKEEINTLTDIKFSYKTKKWGREVYWLDIAVENKSNDELIQLEDFSELTEKTDSFEQKKEKLNDFETLKTIYGLSEAQAKTALSRLDKKALWNKLGEVDEYVQKLKEKGKNVKNLGALTNTFIYNEWGALNGHFHPPKKKT